MGYVPCKGLNVQLVALSLRLIELLPYESVIIHSFFSIRLLFRNASGYSQRPRSDVCSTLSADVKLFVSIFSLICVIRQCQ